MSRPSQQEAHLGPPPRFVRLGSRSRRRRVPRGLIIVAVVCLIALFVVLTILKSLYLDLLWFRSVGYSSVYTTRITTRIWLFFAGAGVSLAFIAGNVLAARRIAPTADVPDFEVSPELGDLFQGVTQPAARRIALIGALLFFAIAVLSFASSASGHWEEILLYLHAQSFGREDPQFHRDLGFYVFELPVLRYAVDWLLTLGVVALIATAAVYTLRAIVYGFRVDAPRPIMRHLFSIEAPWRIKLHISLLLLFLLALFIVRYFLSRYALVYSTQGVDVGAFYTDLHATLPMIYVRIAVAAVAAVLVLVGLFRGGLILPAFALALWLVVAVTSNVYPALVQRFVVQPNELSKEQTYLARNIEMTRWAYGLDQIDEQQFPANPSATEAAMHADQDTLDNVRLWDPQPLQAALNQLQTIRPLFQFRDVDVDRYTIDGQYRQVMLSVRELNPGGLPSDAQTWVNRTLQFTHGYGFTMAAVNTSQPDGSPGLIVQDIPLQGPVTTDRPEVYFGEQPDKFIVVDGNQPEFTPTAGGTNVETRFQGTGGVSLGSFWRRALFAWQFADPNLLISGAITSDSRIIYRRNVQQRIREIAPFLKLDADPYMVVDSANMYWVQDAYTVTDRIPYSHDDSTTGQNYMRNSVKVVVNAYSGAVDFYVTQPDEPILNAYSAIFPSLFKPLSDMPQSLQSHLRYPEDLFRFQTDAYLRYHIEDARAFYQKEDQWDVPTEIFGGTDQRLRPYYVLARLPNSAQSEFMLILTFVPRNRTNAIGWIAARSDGANYGQLVTYRFPVSESIPGPTQVERRIDSDGRVSQQLTLWNQSGSKVIRGDLLMIPIGGANVFFEPLYLAATTGGNEIPQLKRVVVVNGDTVVMEPTIAQAIAVMFGHAAPSGLDSSGVPSASASPTPTANATAGSTTTPTQPPSATSTGTPSSLPTDVASLAALAQDSYNRAQQLLRAGDFAGYGAEVDHLKQILDRLQQVAGTPVPRP
jgi:uncharacterized protein